MQPMPISEYPTISRLKLPYGLALVGLATAFYLLTRHVPRRFVEAELALPMLLLLYIARPIAALERQAAGAEPLAPLVAIVGCDGAGKSTLSADMRAFLAAERRVECHYLGLGSGELGNRIRQWPLIGPALERKLARKAAQTRNKQEKIPGVLTALVVFGFSLLRLRRFRRVLALRRRGVTVITDRYPQTEVAGFYDGPGLSAARAGGPVVAWLAARERRMYDWMAGFRPDIVLRLNVDADTALRRKPDHKPDLLRAKVEATPLLRFRDARIVDIDAGARYADVRDQALVHIRWMLAGTDPDRASAAVTRRPEGVRP